MQVARCAMASCTLMNGADRCPLLDEAGIALYHEAVLSDAFVERLRSARSRAMAIATRDRHRADGEHEPAMSRVIASPAT